MRDYLIYKDKTSKRFRKLMNTGSGIFDKYRTLATRFLKYSVSDFDDKLAKYNADLDLNSIQLETVFPTQFKVMVKASSLRASRAYLENLENRITEFENGKEDNLKILVGVQFLRYVFLAKVVEMYLESASSIKAAGGDISGLTLKEIGITKKMLSYYTPLIELGEKSIDEWLSMSIDPTVAKHFYSSMKRMLTILMSVSDK